MTYTLALLVSGLLLMYLLCRLLVHELASAFMTSLS